jgi:hypothetical protein
MRIYYVELLNSTDSQDDEMAKVRAKSPERARQTFERRYRAGFKVGRVYTAKECREERPEWYSLIRRNYPNPEDP